MAVGIPVVPLAMGRRVFQIGLAVFAAGSLLCSLAPDIHTLIAARFIQGVGGSMLNPVALSIISQVFVGRVERARALGFWGAVVGISMALGPIVGGLLIEFVGWRAVFWINLPICAAAIILTAVFVPESKSTTMRDVDPIGQALAIVFLFAIVFFLIEGPNIGWMSAQAIGVLTAALTALAGFLVYESRRRDPFIDLRFFRSIPFATATVIAISTFAAWAAFIFMMSVYMQSQLHYSPMQTGLIFLPIAVGALVFSPLSGRLVGRYGARPSLVSAGLLITTACVLLAAMTEATPVWMLLTIFTVFGIGFGMVNAPVTNSAVSGMPRDRAGAASAVTSTSRQVGVSIGVALCGSLAGSALAVGGSDFVAAARPLWWVCIGLGVCVTVLAITSTTSRAVRSAQRLSPLIADADGALEAPHAA